MPARKTAATALLLVDFINLFDFDEARQLAPRAIRAARCTARLKARAAAENVPCIYANDNFGNWTSEFSALTAQCKRKPGAPGEIARILSPTRNDLSVLKPRHSAFYGTPLAFLLDELGVKNLVVTGLTADICVFATAQDAYVRQFRVWVPADCVASFNLQFERAALAHMARTLKADTRSGGRARTLAWHPART